MSRPSYNNMPQCSSNGQHINDCPCHCLAKHLIVVSTGAWTRTIERGTNLRGRTLNLDFYCLGKGELARLFHFVFGMALGHIMWQVHVSEMGHSTYTRTHQQQHASHNARSVFHRGFVDLLSSAVAWMIGLQCSLVLGPVWPWPWV